MPKQALTFGSEGDVEGGQRGKDEREDGYHGGKDLVLRGRTCAGDGCNAAGRASGVQHCAQQCVQYRVVGRGGSAQDYAWVRHDPL